MTQAVDKNELRKVPYIDHIPLDGRTVFLQPHFDQENDTFKMFVPRENKLNWIFAEPVEACYYAEEIVDKSKDIYIKLVDVIARYYSFDSVLRILLSIIRDIENCSAVMEKYFVFLDLFRNTKDVQTSNLIITDLEYFFGTVRSLYDLLHDVIRELWRRIKPDKPLPDSFRKMAQRKPEDLERKYDLPRSLIRYYADRKDFFSKCRKIRDDIYHRGLNVRVVFCMEDGFALQKNNPLIPSPLTSEFDIWPKEKTKKNNLVSLLALLSHINKKLLEDVNALSDSLVQAIPPPSPISQTHKVFLRGPYTHHLLRSKRYLEKQWFPPQQETRTR